MTKRCVHHWLIDSENIGTCRKCGAVRDFGKLQVRMGRGPVSLTRREAALLLWSDSEYREKQGEGRKGHRTYGVR